MGYKWQCFEFARRWLYVNNGVEHCKLPDNRTWSRELPLHRDAEGSYHIESAFTDSRIKGWVIQTFDARHAVKIARNRPQLYQLNSRLSHPGLHFRCSGQICR